MKKKFLIVGALLMFAAINLSTLHIAQARMVSDDPPVDQIILSQDYHMYPACPKIEKGWYHAYCTTKPSAWGNCFISRCGLFLDERDSQSKEK